jgi:4-amino-4-deoxy-L-arabinose transferase-like glycosyltransferase
MIRRRPHRAALGLVLAFSALLECFRLGQNSWANDYYSAAVKSMLGSLHNFFFVSSDPSGLITVDKPPLGLWLQTLSAAIFGFHPLSLLIPEALCAVAAVAVMYFAVAPRFGAWAGIASAAALAVFPSFVASARDNNLDALLILLLTLACLAGLRAIDTGQWRWLMSTAVLVGLAFNTKTLAAYLVLPGLALAWIVCAPGSLRRRATMLAGAAVVLAAVSLVWLLAVDAVPGSQRPYVGGTLDNSELSLSFGHNGFGRVLGERGAPGHIVHVHTHATRAGGTPERAPLVRASRAPAAHRANGVTSSAGPAGPWRLFDLADGDQGAWMLPLAIAGLLAIAVQARGRGRRDPRLALLFVLGGWLVVEAVVLSVSTGIVHPYYVSALGPGVAAMVGAGAGAFAQRGPPRRLTLLIAAAGFVATIGVQLLLAHREYSYMRWLWPVIVVIVGAGLVLMATNKRFSAVAAGACVLAALVLPAIYSSTVWQVPVNGTFPAAGPYIPDDVDAASFGIPPDDVQSYRTLIRYVRPREPGSRWDVLVQSSNTAAALILIGGRAAALGGYGTTDPVLTPAALAKLVARGETRFVALGGGYASRGGNAASAAAAQACRQVAPQHWRSPHNFGTPSHPRLEYPQGGWNLVLYDCAGRERELARA